MAHSIDGLVELAIPKKIANQNGGGWSFDVDGVEDFAWQSGVFTGDEMDAIIRIGESFSPTKGTISNGITDPIRESHVSFLFPSDETSWIFGRIAGAMVGLNSQFFNFDLDGLHQGIQFTRYTAPSEHYDWHMDRAFGTQPRKLSLSVQLSHPDSYEGGDLELRVGSGTVNAKRDRGTAIAFPSYTLHRVAPVTSGTRYSLVAWATGKPFK